MHAPQTVVGTDESVNKLLVVATELGVQVTRQFTSHSDPNFELNDGQTSISEPNTACRYVATELATQKRFYPAGGTNQRAAIDELIDNSPVRVKGAWLLPGIGKISDASIRKRAGLGLVNTYLDALNRRLRANQSDATTSLVSSEHSLADFVVASDLLCLLPTVGDELFSHHPMILNFLFSVSTLTSFARIFGQTRLPKKQELQSSDSQTNSVGHPVWPANVVRQSFFDFFKLKGHEIVDSSPVVPRDDPTLLFANAGMNQFKPIFLGQIDPNSKFANLKRAADTQKCIRAGGKHNDLDDVGKDTYHHTFFEMLGNWSFGDYFKRDAIEYAWELLTDVYGLPPERLYATYFEGDVSQGVPKDTEARDIWLEKLPPSRVLAFGAEDNMWEMGDTGPCGPCTEIHFDRIGGREASSLVNMDDPDVLEIWNLVFIQFKRESDGKLNELPSKHVDTGMGFERMCSILQGCTSNYDTDVFVPLFDAISAQTNAGEYTGKMGEEDRLNGSKDMAFRVVADHIRALGLAIADGSAPGNEGREYVLRRILRRAVRYGRDCLGGPVGFFSGLFPSLEKQLGDVFPELRDKADKVVESIKEEESAFEKTILRGVEQFKKMVVKMEKGDDTLSGGDAFLLWDTFGFPLDLTELMCQERGLKVDKDGFDSAMQRQRDRSRQNAKASAAASIPLDSETTDGLNKRSIPPTDDSFKYSQEQRFEAKIMAIVTPNGLMQPWERLDSKGESSGRCTEGKLAGVVLDRTTFYAEQGGQVSDTGTMTSQSGEMQITSVQISSAFVVHIGEVDGIIECNETVTCNVNYERRALIAPNHTMTHMLNLALRKTLGDGVDQKGSLVDENKLRFDFNHSKPVDNESLTKIRDLSFRAISANDQVYSKEVALNSALGIRNIRAVFGEVYPDPVRVVSVGVPVDKLLEEPTSSEWDDVSVELCGGTHVSNAKDAEGFEVLSEEGIAKGIRRITAVTKAKAKEANRNADSVEEKIEEAKGAKEEEMEEEVNRIKKEMERMTMPQNRKGEIEKRVNELSRKAIEFAKRQAKENKRMADEEMQREIDGMSSNPQQGKELILLKHFPDNVDTKALMHSALRAKRNNIPALVASVDGKKGKVLSHCAVPDWLAKSLPPLDWLNAFLSPLSGHCGGGHAGLASGQGNDPTSIAFALQSAREKAEKCLL